METMLVILVVCVATCMLWLLVKSCMAHRENASSKEEAILITGCDTGIGLELAKYFHQTTSFTIICGLLGGQHSEAYKELQELDANSGRFVLEKLDITSEDDVQRLVKKISKLQQEGRIKQLVALINNAGVLAFGEFDWYTWDIIESQVNVNLLGTIRITRAMLPFIIDGQGRIINTSTIADSALFPFSSIYLVTKSGVSRFTKVLNYEMARFGVRAITVRPGPCMTKINANHQAQRDKMWHSMDARKRKLYGDNFNRAYDLVQEGHREEKPAGFLPISSVLVYFRRALLSKDPPQIVTCLPVHLKIALTLVEWSPSWLQERILDWTLPPAYKRQPSRGPPSGQLKSVAVV